MIEKSIRQGQVFPQTITKCTGPAGNASIQVRLQPHVFRKIQPEFTGLVLQTGRRRHAQRRQHVLQGADGLCVRVLVNHHVQHPLLQVLPVVIGNFVRHPAHLVLRKSLQCGLNARRACTGVVNAHDRALALERLVHRPVALVRIVMGFGDIGLTPQGRELCCQHLTAAPAALVIHFRRPPADSRELAAAAALLKTAKQPLIVAGGGVLYSQAWDALRAFAEAHGVPVVESHGGKSSLPWDHPLNLGGIGVDGGPAANALAREADLVLAVGTRLQDFTTGSHALFAKAKLLSLNVQSFDAGKWSGTALVADARIGLGQLSSAVGDWKADARWTAHVQTQAAGWVARVTELTTAVPKDVLPYDAEVMGAVRDSLNDAGGDSGQHDVVVCAAGTLPAELHKLWRASKPGNYHVEYGYSCMGYEIAGALGAKMARPHQEVIVMVGDGSYMMMNSEIATSVLLGQKLIIVVLDNRGYGCIERLQLKSGSPSFNNMLDDCIPEGGNPSQIDFAMHGRSMGAEAVHVKDVVELKAAMVKARAATRTQVIVIDTTHHRVTAEGGCWWEVAIPQVSERTEVHEALVRYVTAKQDQRV